MAQQTYGNGRKRRRKISPRKIIRYYGPVLLAVCLCVVMCVPVHRSEDDGTEILPDEAPVVQIMKGTTVRDLERVDTVSYHKRHLEEMPEPTQRIKVNYFGSERAYFNDSNHVHLAEARQYGIDPLTDTRSHWRLRRPIVRVTSCEDFYVDTLIFSRPYLVPEAAGRLHEIGRRFRDTIEARGGGDYRIKVTSLLRTPQTVRRLRRRNRNAIDSSVHQYGTTFDISYAAFIADAPAPARSTDDLKGILGEVLRAMREEGKLWVKYERGQPCYHITARKPGDTPND